MIENRKGQVAFSGLPLAGEMPARGLLRNGEGFGCTLSERNITTWGNPHRRSGAAGQHFTRAEGRRPKRPAVGHSASGWTSNGCREFQVRFLTCSAGERERRRQRGAQ